MKSTAVHPADAIDAARVASAACYVATIFIGTGRFDRAAHATLAHAKETAGLMEAHYRNGRRAMIYAVLPCGGAALVVPGGESLNWR